MGSGLVILVVAVASLALIQWPWRDTVAVPVPRSAEAEHSAGARSAVRNSPGLVASEAGDLSSSAQVKQPEAQRLSVAPGVYGRLLDQRGTPMAGFLVRLRSVPDVGAWDSELVTTNVTGGFAFPAAAAGDYSLETAPFGYVSQELTLGEGEHRHVELQLGASMVAVTCRFTRDGEAVDKLWLSMQKQGKWQRAYTSEQGTEYHVVLPAGQQTIGVYVRSNPIFADVPACQCVLLLPHGQARWQGTIALSFNELFVAVLDEFGDSAQGCHVLLRAPKHEIYQNEWVKSVGARGVIFSGLAPATYDLSVAGADVAVPEAQQVIIPAGGARVTVRLQVQRALMLRLILRCGGRELGVLPGQCAPVLRVPDGERRYQQLTGRWGTYRGRGFGFDKVLPGRVAIVSQDQELAGEKLFLAFDPLADHYFDVLPRQENTLTLDVMRRAMVDLRACEANGREQFDAKISVFAGDQQVRSHKVRGSQRFLSFVPPGDYRVVIDRKGTVREHSLVVARQDVRLRLRP